MRRFVLAVLLLAAVPVIAEQFPLQTAKVISQEIGESRGGAAVLPLNGGLIGVPIMRRSNIVVLETTRERMTLAEMPNRHFLVLPVNGTVFYFADKGQIVMLDANRKKHKFSIVHLEEIVQQK